MSDHAAKTAALLAYDGDLLSVAGTARIELHLASCPRCQRELTAIRAYDALQRDVRAAGPPEPDWAAMELTLRREARTQAAAIRAQRGRRKWPFLVAAAAAALLAYLSWPGPPAQPTARHEMPGSQEPVAAVTPAEREGQVTVVVGAAELDGRPVHVGTAVATGMVLRTTAGASAHIQLGSGTGAVVHERSEVTLEALATGATVLSLGRGTVSSQVAALEEGERYEVQAGPWQVRVHGTRFAVSYSDGALAVTLDEGTVEVLENGELVELLEAPASFRSGGDRAVAGLAPVAQGEVPVPRGLRAADLDNPTVRLGPSERFATFAIGGVTYAARGGIELRLPPGDVSVEARDQRGNVFRAEFAVGPHGGTLDEGILRPDAPPVRSGELAAELIRPVVARGIRRLQRCRDDASRGSPSEVVGRFTLTLNIDRLGEVRRARLSIDRGTAPPAPFVACVETEAMAWVFPPPTGGVVEVAVPLTFSTRSH